MDDHPDTLVTVQYHLSDIYQVDFCVNRSNYYSVSGIPFTAFDGVRLHPGGGDPDVLYSTFTNSYNIRAAAPTDMTVDLNIVEVAPATYDATATIAIEPGGTAKDLTIHMIQVLDYYPNGAHYRNCCMAAGDNELVDNMQPGESIQITRRFELTGDSWINKEDASIICWAREQGGGNPPKQVYNVAQVRWPFTDPGVPGDVDGDGDVDLSDLAALLAAYDTCVGDPDYNAAADFSGDGCVDLVDLSTMLANFGFGT